MGRRTTLDQKTWCHERDANSPGAKWEEVGSFRTSSPEATGRDEVSLFCRWWTWRMTLDDHEDQQRTERRTRSPVARSSRRSRSPEEDGPPREPGSSQGFFLSEGVFPCHSRLTVAGQQDEPNSSHQQWHQEFQIELLRSCCRTGSVLYQHLACSLGRTAKRKAKKIKTSKWRILLFEFYCLLVSVDSIEQEVPLVFTQILFNGSITVFQCWGHTVWFIYRLCYMKGFAAVTTEAFWCMVLLPHSVKYIYTLVKLFCLQDGYQVSRSLYISPVKR